jgi:hypothetical protein
MKIRAALLIAIALFAPEAAAFSDDDFCRAMQERAQSENPRKPAWVDREIRDDGMTVLCVQKTIEHKRFFNIEPDAMGRDWERRLSAQWNLRQCREPTLTAIRNGWQFVEITRFPKSRTHPYGRELRAVANCR